MLWGNSGRIFRFWYEKSRWLELLWYILSRTLIECVTCWIILNLRRTNFISRFNLSYLFHILITLHHLWLHPVLSNLQVFSTLSLSVIPWWWLLRDHLILSLVNHFIIGLAIDHFIFGYLSQWDITLMIFFIFSHSYL